jgi:peptide-methionine (S)-S-oxide reductase
MLMLGVAAGGCGRETQDMGGPKKSQRKAKQGPQLATFGAGCFWGVEAAYRRVPGVIETAVGYAGGDVDNPEYREICSGATGHAEVVQVTYDPAKVSYDALLAVFWSCHDPTLLNRQGVDVGTQYRSAIFYHTPEQKSAAAASMEDLAKSGRLGGDITTEITPAAPFWRAEEYHQRFLEKHPEISCPTLPTAPAPNTDDSPAPNADNR